MKTTGTKKSLTVRQSKDKAEASTQEREIYLFLHRNKNEKFTKTEIFRELVRTGKISERTPESSINRGLSNFRDRGLIVKLKDKKLGGFRVKISLWKIIETIPVGTQTDLVKP